MHVIRLHPAVDTVAPASHVPCQGRFEIEVDSESDWSELVSVVSSHISQKPVKLLFNLNSLPLSGSMKHWLEGLRDIPILVYSVYCSTSDASTQTRFLKPKLHRTDSGPPAGVSRFKYLQIRDKITKT